MGLLVVGIGDCQVSAATSDELVTYALGSCVAVIIHDPLVKVGGLLHLMLPDSSLDPEKARANPFMFADSGIPLLFRRAYILGARKERLATRLVGGAQMNASGAVWNVGKYNTAAARRILTRAGVRVQKEVVGGAKARTVRLNVLTGEMQVAETKADQIETSWVKGPGGDDERETDTCSGG
jgi:chemotaxis protein CheD